MAKYIKSLSIDTFRGIKNLELQDFGDVNIFTGGNNCGKTSVLELILSIQNPFLLWTWDWISRRAPLEKYSNMCFYEQLNNLFDVDAEHKRIKYSYQLNNKENCNVEIAQEVDTATLTEDEIMKIDPRAGMRILDLDDTKKIREYPVKKMKLQFKKNHNIVSERSIYDFQRMNDRYEDYGDNLEISNISYIYPEEHLLHDCFLGNVFEEPEMYQELLEILKSFDEDIISINATVDKITKNPVYKFLSAKHKTAIPLNMYGDGMKKVLRLIENMCGSKNGVMIIDEFETGIHTSGMERIFGWLVKTCKKLNIQLFLCSHSIEAIEKLIKSTSDMDIDMKLYTLYREDGENLVRSMDAREAVKFYNEMGLELR